MAIASWSPVSGGLLKAWGKVAAILAHASRLIRHAVPERDGSWIWIAFDAQLALGTRMYDMGVGDERLRRQITALDRRIHRARGSARALRTERDRLVLRLSASGLDHPAPAGAEAEHRRAKDAQAALDRHIDEINRARAGWTWVAPPAGSPDPV